MERGHAEALMPMVLATMAKARVGFGDLDAVAVTVGPGAFTGIRVGLAAARGISLAAGLPCLGVGTLEAVAAAVPAEQRSGGSVLAVIDTRRGDVFAQAFANDGSPLDDPKIVALDQVAHMALLPPVVVAGDAARSVVRHLVEGGLAARAAPAPSGSGASVVAEIAARRWDGCAVSSMPAPLYLRPPSVTRAVASGRERS